MLSGASEPISSDIVQYSELTDTVLANIGKDKTGSTLEKTLDENPLLKERVVQVADTMFTIDFTKYISSLKVSISLFDLISAIREESVTMNSTIEDVSTKLVRLAEVIVSDLPYFATASLDCVSYHSNALTLFQEALKKSTFEEQKRQIQVTLDEIAKCEEVAKQFSVKSSNCLSQIETVINAIRGALLTTSSELTKTSSEKEKLDKQIAAQIAKIQGMQERFDELRKAEKEEEAKQPADHRNFFTSMIPWEVEADKDYKKAVEARERHLREIRENQNKLNQEMESFQREKSVASSELSIAESVVRVLTDILKVTGVLKTFSSDANLFWSNLAIRCNGLQKMNLERIAINARFETGVNNSLRKGALYWMAVGHIYYAPYNSVSRSLTIEHAVEQLTDWLSRI
ncbi:hypothetical protein QUA46_06750 [Microcoleus sp. MON2_D6]|uniref:hypothetical protein n=1 Tax=unclassified Microcoleus TaxID=2642155 RepID=UPI002FD6BA0B